MKKNGKPVMPGAKYQARLSATGRLTVDIKLPFQVRLGHPGCRRIHRILGNLRDAIAVSIAPLWKG